MRYSEIIITSRQNPLICEVASLLKRRERDESGRFIMDGKKLCFEYIRYVGSPVYLFVNEKQRDKLADELSELEVECGITLNITLVSESAFMKMTEQKAPDGIIAIGERHLLPHEYIRVGDHFDFSGERVIAMSSLRDTGNVGTVIRTALAFGYDRVLLSGDCADIYSPKTLRATMGAAFSMKLTVCDSLPEVVARLVKGGRRVYSAELRENAISLDAITVSESDVFVVGNEGHGIEASVSESSSASVYIPISDRSESLNAAIAASVLMWHQSSRAF